jgi:hypothetical protein
LVGALLGVVLAAPAIGATPRDTPLPMLLWTKDEAAAIKKLIDTEPWAKEQFARQFPPVSSYEGRPFIDNLFRYLVLGDQKAGEHERNLLLPFVGTYPYVKDPFDWMWHHVDNTAHALRYDILYDLLTPGQRKAVENTFRQHARYGVEEERLRGFSSYPRHPSHHILSLPLRDQRLIQGIFTTSGGLKEHLDGLLDGQFPQGSIGDPPHLLYILLWCRACERMGLDDIGYGYVGKNGGTVRKLLESRAVTACPIIDIPGRPPYYGRATVGSWGATGPEIFPGPVVPTPLVIPASRGGRDQDRAATWGNCAGEHARNYALCYELAHRKWPDAGFDGWLAMNRQDDKYYYPSFYFGLKPIPASAAGLPPLASMALRQSGLGILRGEEGSGAWTSPAPAVFFDSGTGRRRYGGNLLSLMSVYAFNRPVYLTPFRAVFDRGYHGGINHRSNNNVVVDNLMWETAIRGDRYDRFIAWPKPPGAAPLRSGFDGLVKFLAARAKPAEVESTDADANTRKELRQAYPGVDLERALFLTREYVLDVFRLAGDREHQYHWMVHPLGQAQYDEGASWKPSDDLGRDLRDFYGDDSTCLDAKGKVRQVRGAGGPPRYRFAEGKACGGEQTWSVTAMQTCAVGEATSSRMGEGWYARKIGVRMTMLGEPGTTAYTAKLLPGASPESKDVATSTQPIGPPFQSMIMRDPGSMGEIGGFTILAGRKAARTVFVALHEPFEKGRWNIAGFRRIAQSDQALAVAVAGKEGSPVNDRLMVAMGDAEKQSVTLSGEGESFTFTDRGYVRVGKDKVEAGGPITALKVKVAGQPRLILNGKDEKVSIDAGVLSFGKG